MSNKKTNILVENFLKSFAGHHKKIRDEIAKSLPSYNKLLSLHATSFQDIALKPYAIAQKYDITDPLFDYRSANIKPPCVQCHETDKVYRTSDGFNCKKCGIRFVPHHKSIVYRSNRDALTWMKFLYCILDFYTVERTRDYCGISNKTYYSMRNKIFYAMEIMMNDLKLYGLIECDHKLEHASYKGDNLNENNYPEDSPFYREHFTPREARKRGGPYPNSCKDVNSVTIFAAIDNYGHSMARYVGLGKPTATRLIRAVPASKFFSEIPDKDPFEYMRPEINKKSYDSDKSMLVTDGENIFGAFANAIGMQEHEDHVYRRNGKQLRLSKTAHDIQRVNSLHSRLSSFLTKLHHGATKYLPGYLVMFEFIENTGASDKAIERLFDILVTPGLGQSASFYEEKYSSPNYLLEWQEDNALLRKYNYDQLVAIYLYHRNKLAKKNKTIPTVTMQEILDETGIKSANTVRKLHKKAAAAGVAEFIYNKMNTMTKAKLKKQPSKKSKQTKKKYEKVSDFCLRFYDERCKNYELPYEEQITFKEHLRRFSEQVGETKPITTVDRQLKHIDKMGLKSVSLSELKENNKVKKQDAEKRRMIQRGERFIAEIEQIRSEYEQKREPIPPKDVLLEKVSEKNNLSVSTVKKMVTAAYSARRVSD